MVEKRVPVQVRVPEDLAKFMRVTAALNTHGPQQEMHDEAVKKLNSKCLKIKGNVTANKKPAVRFLPTLMMVGTLINIRVLKEIYEVGKTIAEENHISQRSYFYTAVYEYFVELGYKPNERDTKC